MRGVTFDGLADGAGSGVPHEQAPVFPPSAAGNCSAVGGIDSAVDVAYISDEPLPQLSGAYIPDARCFVKTAAHKRFSRRGEVDRHDAGGMSFERRFASACLDIPEPRRCVVAAGRKRQAVRGEGGACDRVFVSNEGRFLFIVGLHIPEARRAVSASAGEQRAVGRVGDAIDDVGMTFKGVDELSASRVPYPRGMIIACAGDESSVRRISGVDQRIGRLLKRRYHLACIGVPQLGFVWAGEYERSPVRRKGGGERRPVQQVPFSVCLRVVDPCAGVGADRHQLPVGRVGDVGEPPFAETRGGAFRQVPLRISVRSRHTPPFNLPVD